MLTTDMGSCPFLCWLAMSPAGPVEPASEAGTPTRGSSRRVEGTKFELNGTYAPAMTRSGDPGVLPAIGDAIRSSAWDLGAEIVDEGLRDDTLPSLSRLGRLGQLGDLPTFIAELGRELAEPATDRIRRGSPLSVLVRDHARSREGLGFSPREIVIEFLLLRRVLWRFLAPQAR